MAQKASLYCRMIVRDGDSILLTCEQSPDHPHPLWFVPGGSVEEGESPRAAAIRETAEETGIRVTRVRELAWCNYLLRAGSTNGAVAFNFVADAWEGTLAPNDPDKLAIDARFVPLTEAIELMEQIPWRYMCEPVIAYLRGEITDGFRHIQPGDDDSCRYIED